MRFTLRQLEYFVATCDAGSVTEAAQRIPVAQSSVSAAIAQLEAALGVQLLIRHHAQGVSPTPAGRRFEAKARGLLREAGELESFAWELTEDVSGLLEVGCLITLAPLVMPRLCRAFRDRHPGVTVRPTELGQEELLTGLRAGRLSLALTYDLDLGPEVAFEPLATLAPHVVLPAEHPLAAREGLSLRDLEGESLVLLDLPHSRDYFRSLFTAEGLEPDVVHRSGQPEVIRSMVANGYGYTLINARPVNEQALDGRPLRTVPLDGSPRAMVLGLASLAGARPTRVVTAFRDHCREAVASGTLPGLGADGR